MPKQNRENRPEVVSVRMTRSMKDTVVSAAEEDHRSITDELVFLISKGLEVRDRLKKAEQNILGSYGDEQSHATGGQMTAAEKQEKYQAG